MGYETKEIAMQHVSTNRAVATKQIDMIDCMYRIGEKVSQNDLDNIALDVSDAATKKAMSY